jgi:hypothetical protein
VRVTHLTQIQLAFYVPRMHDMCAPNCFYAGIVRDDTPRPRLSPTGSRLPITDIEGIVRVQSGEGAQLSVPRKPRRILDTRSASIAGAPSL